MDWIGKEAREYPLVIACDQQPETSYYIEIIDVITKLSSACFRS